MRLAIAALVFFVVNVVVAGAYFAFSGNTLGITTRQFEDSVERFDSGVGSDELPRLTEAKTWIGAAYSSAREKFDEQFLGVPPIPSTKIVMGAGKMPVSDIAKDDWLARRGDRFARQLKKATAHYNRPTLIQPGEISEIALVIDPGHIPLQRDPLIRLPGEHETAEVLIGNEVTARLSGPPHFSIVPRSPEKQLITPVGYTQWLWNISPKEPTNAILTLEVIATVRLAGSAKQGTILTERFEIPVSVSMWHTAKIYAGRLGPVALSAAPVISSLAAILTWLGLKPQRKRRRRTAKA